MVTLYLEQPGMGQSKWSCYHATTPDITRCPDNKTSSPEKKSTQSEKLSPTFLTWQSDSSIHGRLLHSCLSEAQLTSFRF